MGKETGIEAAYFLIDSGTDKQTGPCCPEDIGRRIILGFIFFYDMEHASPAIRIPVNVHITAGSSGIFEIFLVALCPYLGLGGGDGGIGLKGCQWCVEPAGGYFDITVQQDGIFVVELFECLVVSFGETVVLIQPDNADGRELFLQQGYRVVGRTIIGHDYFRPFCRTVCYYRREKFFHQLRTVPVKDDDGYFFS